MNVIVALDGPRAAELAEALADEGMAPTAVLSPFEFGQALNDPGAELWAVLGEADALLLPATRDALTAGAVAACDRHGVRILPLADRAGEVRLARSFGLSEPLPRAAEGWRIAEALLHAEPAPASLPERARGSVIAVWGPHGAPGRTTLAIELATELARLRGHVALVDADTHAPAVAIALGLADEGPGFAAACRQAELGGLDAAELTRLSIPVGGADGLVAVLPGLNRVGRWPELSPHRVEAALEVCRDWADAIVVDVAATMEADEEIVSDVIDGPRRNGATLAALRTADRIIAVAAADPVGISRFLRGYAELRGLVGATPVTVVVNRLRAGPVGIDGRGQIRRTLERFAGIDDVLFVPFDLRAADAALREARPVAELAARSPLAQAVRRVAERIAGGRAPRQERRRAASHRRGRAGVRRERTSID